jgi:hypothetical protein
LLIQTSNPSLKFQSFSKKIKPILKKCEPKTHFAMNWYDCRTAGPVELELLEANSLIVLQQFPACENAGAEHGGPGNGSKSMSSLRGRAIDSETGRGPRPEYGDAFSTGIVSVWFEPSGRSKGG